jgi:hypothetical protein
MINFIQISLGGPASINDPEEEGGILSETSVIHVHYIVLHSLKLNSSGIHESNPDTPTHFL